MVQSPSFSHEVTTIALLSVWHEIQTSKFKQYTTDNDQLNPQTIANNSFTIATHVLYGTESTATCQIVIQNIGPP